MKRSFGSWVQKPSVSDAHDQRSLSPFKGFSHTDNQRRSLYDALVDKGMPPSIKSTDTPTYYDPEKQRVVLGWIMEQGLVPWDTSEQFIRLMDMFSKGLVDKDTYHHLRSDIGKIAYARESARRMRWQLTPEQLTFLATKGK